MPGLGGGGATALMRHVCVVCVPDDLAGSWPRITGQDRLFIKVASWNLRLGFPGFYHCIQLVRSLGQAGVEFVCELIV